MPGVDLAEGNLLPKNPRLLDRQAGSLWSMKSFAASVSLVFAVGCLIAAVGGGLNNPSMEIDVISCGGFLVAGFALLAKPQGAESNTP